jgi:hypothetical protein
LIENPGSPKPGDRIGLTGCALPRASIREFAFRDMLGWWRAALWVVSNDTAVIVRRTHSKADGPHIGLQAETVALVQVRWVAGASPVH